MRISATLSIAAFLFVVGLMISFHFGFFPGPTGPYDHATVTLEDPQTGEESVVEVRVAQTIHEQYTGLTKTPSLGANEGMLFVFESEGERSLVMRGMDYDLDMVFVSATGEVTHIETVEAPTGLRSRLNLTRYSGEGKYVIELPSGWAADNGVSEGSLMTIEYKRDVA